MYKMTVFLLASLLSTSSFAALKVGSDLNKHHLELKGDEGGKVSGGLWNSKEMLGKMAVIFYVDPDNKNINNKLSDALKKKKFDKNFVNFFGVINMAASWLPNWAINGALKEKQAAYPDTTYIRDMDRKLVKQWGFTDDDSEIIIFDKMGKLLYKQAGRHEQADIDKVIQLIEKELAVQSQKS